MDMQTFWSLAKPKGWTQQRLADELGIKQGAVSQWGKVPVARVRDVARLTGIKPEKLRPDIFSKVGA